MTFRSIEMVHFRLFLPRESYYHSVEELLQLGNAHLLDIGNPLNRPFFQQVKRCDELLLKIHSIVEAVKEKEMVFEQYNQMERSYIDDLHSLWDGQARQYGLEKSKLLDHYENEIHENWEKFMEKKNGIDKLKANQKSSLSKIACFQALGNFFGESRQMGELGMDGGRGISTMVGVIDPASELRLSKTIYRVSRGYAFLKSVDTFRFEGLRNFGNKVVILIYPNSSTGVLEKKITRVMQTFCTSLFLFREGDQTHEELKRGAKEYDEVMNLLQMNERQMGNLLTSLSGRHFIETWRTFLWKERLIYESLNKMQLRQHFIVADLYLPRLEKEALISRINRIMPAPEMQELEATKPPTAFNTNSYTLIAQEITNTYGVPRYQQINPSIFTTVTFPFFFGVMFGDIGHGLILFVLGLYLVFNNEAIKRTSFAFASDLRYMVLMMGFFAFYCGWVYNDFLGMDINVFGSCFPISKDNQGKEFYTHNPDCIYPFGIDPIWGVSSNELIFVNSLKMKISVIIAIIHMVLGVIMKFFNASYFRKNLEIFFEFIPQLIFLGLLFGYMDFLIIFKWLTPWNTPDVHPPPSIISTMMDIGLQTGSTSKAHAMWGDDGNSSQDTIQTAILLIAVVCVPLMLLPKPIIEIKRMNRGKNAHMHMHEHLLSEELEAERQAKVNASESNAGFAATRSANKQDHSHDQQHDPSEIFVHQLIETIEFVLGAISNTASYLRLWALSLAHSQLAKVFFSKTLESGFSAGSGYQSMFFMPIMFYMLVWVTFGVLMCMDTMECFLHSLRLHWVQFQNKFYKGDGYAYEPISAKTYILHMKKESVK